jgi:hypothetical protein
MKETLAVIAALLAVIGNISYFKDTLRGVIKPHPYTWFVWTIVSLIALLGQVQKGAGVGALPALVAEFFTIGIFIFSLKYLFRRTAGHIRKVDTYFLVAALLGLIPWVLTNDPTISVIIVVAIDLIAFVPTLRKARAHPETERPLLFQMNVARHGLTLFSLEAYNIATMLHSIAMICANALMTFLIVRRRRTMRTSPNESLSA